MTNLFSSRIEQLLSQQQWLESDIYNVMANIRQLIEVNAKKEKYQILNLYCNWIFHASIKESKVAYRLLEKITDALIKYGSSEYGEGDVSDAVIEGIALHKFFEELVVLGKEYNIKSASKFSDKDVCFDFSYHLLLILVGKPLLIDLKTLDKNKDMRKIVKNIFDKAAKYSVSPDKYITLGFLFVIENNKIHWRLLTKFSIRNKIALLGKFQLVTQDDIDKAKEQRELHFASR